MLPSSGPSHLAEVVLGGLLRRTGGDAPEYLEFRFHEGVRELLLDHLPIREGVQVLNAVGRYIGEHLGETLDFQTFVEDPVGGAEALEMVSESGPFALIAKRLLRRLGGSYTSAGRRVEELVPEIKPRVGPPLPPSPPAPALKEFATFRGHTDVIFRFAWSPDGAVLATPSRDGQVYFWDRAILDVDPTSLERGLTRQLRVSAYGVNQVAWSADGRQIASASFDHIVRIWSYPKLLQVRRFGHNSDVRCVAWSAYGSRLASGTRGGTARIWDSESWSLLQSVRLEAGSVRALAWSPGGDWLAIGTWERQFGICSIDGEIRSRESTSVESGRITCLTWLREPEKVVIGTDTGMAIIWQHGTGISAVFQAHGAGIQGLAADPGSRVLATKSLDGTVKLWRVDTWREIAAVAEATSEFKAAGIAFHPQEPLLAAGVEQDRAVRLWQVDFEALGYTPDRFPVTHSLPHPQPVHRFAWAFGGERLAVPLIDGSVHVWDTVAGKHVRMVPEGGGGVNQVAWSREGSMFAASRYNRKIEVFSVRDASLLWSADLDGDSPCVAFSPDGRCLAAGTMNGSLMIWNVPQRRQIAQLACGTAVWVLAWHPRSGLAVGGTDKILLLDNVHIENTQVVDERPVFASCMTWTGDGRHLLFGNWKGELWTIDGAELAHGRVRKIHDQRITSLSLARGDGLLATKSEDGTVRLWRLDPWGLVGEVREAVVASTMYATVAFHPTEPLLASVGDDGRTVKVRTVPSELLAPAAPHTLVSPRRWILVAGTGKTDLPPTVLAASRRLGRILGERGYGLITGGWRGVDHVVARAFCRVLEAVGGKAEDFLVNVLVEDSSPEYDKGRREQVSSDRESYTRVVELADAVVLIEGLGRTGEMGQTALRVRKPVLPLAATGGDAAKLFDAAAEHWRKLRGGRLPWDLFENLRAPEPDAVDAVDKCLAALFNEPFIEDDAAKQVPTDAATTEQVPSRPIPFPEGDQMVKVGTTRFPEESSDAVVFRHPTTKDPRMIYVPIKFDSPFKKIPQVIVGLQTLDAGDIIVRISVTAEDITSEGFKICFSTWEDSKVYKATASWIAVGE
jgi:WD40 repeat protein